MAQQNTPTSQASTTPTGSPPGVISGILGSRGGYWNHMWEMKNDKPEEGMGPSDDQLFGHEGFNDPCEEAAMAQFLHRRRSSSSSSNDSFGGGERRPSLSLLEQVKFGYKPDGTELKLGSITEKRKTIGDVKDPSTIMT